MFDNNNKAGGAAGLPSFHQASVAAVAMPSRERFYVELKPGETTFVSWKKLLKDSQKTAWAPSPSSEAPTGAHPALEARIAPEVVKGKDPLPPPPNRFNSVIERIERLYQGGNSDNELSDYLDDDKYDTRDSFIDDAELDDYFSVEDAKLKHEGFFVNRGKLEQETELSPSTIAGLKKRKRKDLKNLSTESNEDVSNKLKSGVRLKAAARKVTSPSSGLPSGIDLNSSIQKERKEVPYPLFGRGTGKGTASMVVESDLVNSQANSTVVSGCSKDVARDKTDGKELSKGIAVDRPMLDHMCRVNAMEQAIGSFDVNEPLERDAIVQLEKRETPTINGTKAKRAMKDEDLKETLVGAKKPPPLAAKEVSPGRAKGTVLERAFLDLEKGVAELCPPSLVVREPEQGKRNRLPRDIKQKLAKVARLAAKQGRMTDELIERLMGILGHVVRVKTLKRNLKAMIEMGLSAMQEKEGRLQGIKKEVTEMIKSRVHKLQAQDVSQLDNFQLLGTPSEKASGEGRYQWDHETEDKICDLYEQYIEGMDENKGPHLRKFYAELAELWPDGWMDNIGIKLAVHRAKERKERQSKANNSADTKKRRRPVVKPKMEDLGGGGEMILQLITGGGRRDQSPYEKMSSTSFEHEVCLGHGHEERLSTEEEKKHIMKPGSNERKSKTADGGPPLKKKLKREVDKSGVATSDKALVVLNKSFSTQDAFVGSTVAPIPPSETPPWSMVTHHSVGATPPLNE